jgi:predicted Zn finger-like uncharacterized protein
MVVGCPKCKAKLRVAEEKIRPGGSRFKCPKCASVLMVRKPEAAKTVLDAGRLMVAHSSPDVARDVIALLSERGYEVTAVFDGVEAMVRAMKERPALAVLDVGLPRINGIEILKRLRDRTETRSMKIILTSSFHDEGEGRESALDHGADDYIAEQRMLDALVESVKSLLSPQKASEKAPHPEAAAPAAAEKGDEDVERARRLVRTILSDISLYSGAKVEEAIREGSFRQVFANELREGLKHYENRISPDVRQKGDFFNETVEEFIEKKRDDFGL